MLADVRESLVHVFTFKSHRLDYSSQCPNGQRYDGVMNTMVRIVREEGPRALLKGLTARVTWISLGGFVLFGAYEQSKRILHDLNDKSQR
jgi:hypothetical protein